MGIFIRVLRALHQISAEGLAAALFDISVELPSLILMLSFVTIFQRGLCHAGNLIAGV